MQEAHDALDSEAVPRHPYRRVVELLKKENVPHTFPIQMIVLLKKQSKGMWNY